MQSVHDNEQGTTQKQRKKRNQETKLRDKRNSVREEQFERSQHRDKSKSPLAQINQLSQIILSILKSTLTTFLPNNP